MLRFQLFGEIICGSLSRGRGAPEMSYNSALLEDTTLKLLWIRGAKVIVSGRIWGMCLSFRDFKLRLIQSDIYIWGEFN